MLKITSGRYAAVTSTLALAIAGAGTGYAVTSLPHNSVGTKQLQKNAVTSPKIKNGTISGRDLGKSAVATSPIAVVTVGGKRLVSQTHRAPITGRITMKRVSKGNYTFAFPGYPKFVSGRDGAACSAYDYQSSTVDTDGYGKSFLVHVFGPDGSPSDAGFTCAVYALP
jgi:hypothetical protein